jgi:hypothetical protein
MVLLSIYAFSQSTGYLFRYKKVELKYYPTSESVKIRNIDYQSVVTETIPYSNDLTSSNLVVSFPASVKQDTFKLFYPDKTLVETPFEENNFTLVKVKDIFEEDTTTKDKEEPKITINFNEKIKLSNFTRAIEFWLYSTTKPDIIIKFEAYNKNNVKVLSFSQKITIKSINKWYLESFNILVDNQSKTIENLQISNISFVFPYNLTSDSEFTISISEPKCISIAKDGNTSLPIKRDYITFETSLSTSDWKIRLNDTPKTLNEIGGEEQHSDGIANGKKQFFQFDKKNLSNCKYLLIDFAKDFIVPINNLITILVKGREMGEEVSFILEDARNIYYELSAGYVNFKGWKSIELSIPTSFYLSFFDKDSGVSYVKLLGMKITSGYDKNIDLSIDDISSIANLKY